MNLREGILKNATGENIQDQGAAAFLKAYLADKAIFGEDTAELYSCVYGELLKEDLSTLFESVDEILDPILLEAASTWSQPIQEEGFNSKFIRDEFRNNPITNNSTNLFAAEKLRDIGDAAFSAKMAGLKNSGEFFNRTTDAARRYSEHASNIKDYTGFGSLDYKSDPTGIIQTFTKAGGTSPELTGTAATGVMKVIKNAKTAIKETNPSLFGKIGGFFSSTFSKIKNFFTGEGGTALPFLQGLKKGLNWLVSPTGLPIAIGSAAGLLAVVGIIKFLKKKGATAQAERLEKRMESAKAVSIDTDKKKRACKTKEVSIDTDKKKCACKTKAASIDTDVATLNKIELDMEEVKKEVKRKSKNDFGENYKKASCKTKSMKEEILSVIKSKNDRLESYLKEEFIYEARHNITAMDPRGTPVLIKTLARNYVRTVIAEHGKGIKARQTLLKGFWSTIKGSGLKIGVATNIRKGFQGENKLGTFIGKAGEIAHDKGNLKAATSKGTTFIGKAKNELARESGKQFIGSKISDEEINKALSALFAAIKIECETQGLGKTSAKYTVEKAWDNVPDKTPANH